MNKYFDRKMNFGQSNGAGSAAKDVSGAGGNKTVKEQVLGPIQGPKRMPKGYIEPLSMIQPDSVDAKNQDRPGVPFGMPGVARTGPLITDKSKLLEYKKGTPDFKSGPKGGAFKQSEPLTKIVNNSKPKPKPKPSSSFMEWLIPGFDKTTKAEESKNRKQAKIDDRKRYNAQKGIVEPAVDLKATKVPNAKPKGKTSKAVDSIAKSFTAKNLSNMGKGAVRGGLTSTTGTGGAKTFYDENGKPLEQSGWDAFVGNVPDGSVYSKSEDEIGMTPLGKFDRKMAGTTNAKVGFKKPLDNITSTAGGEPNGKYIQKGAPVKGTEAFSLNFDNAESAVNKKDASSRIAQQLADLEYKRDFVPMSDLQHNETQAKIKSLQDQYQGYQNENSVGVQSGIIDDNMTKKYKGNDANLPRDVGTLIKDATNNEQSYNLLKNSLSQRSYAILDKILNSPSIKSENGQYSVALGESSAGPGGNNLVLTGTSKADLAQQYLQMMMNVSQNPADTKKFIDENFPEEHRRIIYDQINPDSRSVYNSDKSNFIMRNFRNTPVADAPMSPDYGGLVDDGGVIPNWIDENIKG